MTTGEYLVAHSSLPSGTALAHLLALNAGSGSGLGQTIFASRFSVTTGEDRFSVVRKAKRTPIAEAPITHHDRRQNPQSPKFAYATTSIQSAVARTEQDAITVTSRQASTVATRTFEQATINRKRKTS